MTARASEWTRGARAAAAVASVYDGSSWHPYKLEDCILFKLNIRAGKPRRNVHRRETRERNLTVALGLALAAMSTEGYDASVRAIALLADLRTVKDFQEAGSSKETCKELARHFPRGPR